MTHGPATPPPNAKTSTVQHRVRFYETDAMGIVHHSNFVRFLETARVTWLDEHDQPYRDYMADGFHFATTRVEVNYRRPLRFDDVFDVQVWLEWLRGASLRMVYSMTKDGELIATAATEHAMVNSEGRPRRIPRAQRERLQKSLAPGS